MSDFNKIVATNMFVFSTIEYFMWSERINITSLREMDISVREIMNTNQAKYKLQINSSIYLQRSKGVEE